MTVIKIEMTTRDHLWTIRKQTNENSPHFHAYAWNMLSAIKYEQEVSS